MARVWHYTSAIPNTIIQKTLFLPYWSLDGDFFFDSVEIGIEFLQVLKVNCTAAVRLESRNNAIDEVLSGFFSCLTGMRIRIR